jgi:hypothetical protein
MGLKGTNSWNSQMRQIPKLQLVQKTTMSNTVLLYQLKYCSCPHLLLMYTCWTFPWLIHSRIWSSQVNLNFHFKDYDLKETRGSCELVSLAWFLCSMFSQVSNLIKIIIQWQRIKIVIYCLMYVIYKGILGHCLVHCKNRTAVEFHTWDYNRKSMPTM